MLLIMPTYKMLASRRSHYFCFFLLLVAVPRALHVFLCLMLLKLGVLRIAACQPPCYSLRLDYYTHGTCAVYISSPTMSEL